MLHDMIVLPANSQGACHVYFSGQWTEYTHKLSVINIVCVLRLCLVLVL